MSQRYDPRSVANLILDVREVMGYRTTNLEMQKLAFFVYSTFLVATRRPLMKGYFEAWKYGPVHPIIYRSFKEHGSKAIGSKARVSDPITGRTEIAPPIEETETRRTVMETLSRLSAFGAGKLVDLSHVPGGAWDLTIKEDGGRGTLGLRITDDRIISGNNQTNRAILRGDVPSHYSNYAGALDLVEEPFASNRPS